jgi:CubicO group peptidase (beta-lactamase class C family)
MLKWLSERPILPISLPTYDRYQSYQKGRAMTTTIDVQGICDARLHAVREVFAENFAQGREVGASVSITLNGETVVDLWGGSADEMQTRPWIQDTLVNVHSTTKGPPPSTGRSAALEPGKPLPPYRPPS